MAGDTPTIDPRATYQGIPCLAWRAARTPGFESDSYEVEMATAGLAGLKFSPHAQDGLYSAAQGTGPTSSGKAAPGNEGGVPAIGDKLLTRGDLILKDGAREIPLRAIYVRDDGVEVVDTGDNEDGPGVVRLNLVDIRYFWGRRGEIWGRYNIPIPGKDGEYEASSLDGGTAEAPGATTTSRSNGVPLTVKRALILLAARLPGRPPVASVPGSVAEKIPTSLIWEGHNPRDEMERLCALYGLTLGLTFDNRLVFSDSTEKRPAKGKAGAVRAIGDATLAEGAWRRTRRYAYRHRPEAVRVVGPRVVREVRVDGWSPVGHPRNEETGRADTTRFVSWTEAAESYGLTLFDLSSVVLCPEDVRIRFLRSKGLDAVAHEEVMLWAFRMFQIPERQRGFLPILEYRAAKFVTESLGTDEEAENEANALGTSGPDLAEPLVEADTFIAERMRVSEINEGLGTEEDAEGKPVADVETDQPPQPPPEPKLNADGTFGQATIDSLKADSHDPSVTFWRNITRARMPSGSYSLNREAGVLTFRGVHIGRLVRAGIREALQLDAIALEPPPRVRVTFAYEDSADARAALQALGADPAKTGGTIVGTGADQLPDPALGQRESMYHYHALFSTTTSSDDEGSVTKTTQLTKPSLVDPSSVETLDLYRYPLIVRDDTMRLAVTIDKRSNRNELDHRAEEVAAAILAPSQTIDGEDGEALGFYPILPSSVISTVMWEGGPGTCRTRWTIDNAAAAKAIMTGAKIVRAVAARPEGGTAGDAFGGFVRGRS